LVLAGIHFGKEQLKKTRIMSKVLNRIGCSGYYYPMWKEKFYPKGVSPKDWLAYYSTIFNTVELNGTFYRSPKPSDLVKYAKVTPDDFKFSVKMSKYITHIVKLKESKQQVNDFQDLLLEGLGDKCSHFLFQLPPSFHYSEENLERVLTNIPHRPANVIEFRHTSWWNEEVEAALKNVHLTFCNVDFPGLATHFVHTSPQFYLRLHGNPELFKSSYSKKELEFFFKKIPKESNSNNIYFNNTYYDAAYTNALQLMDIIEKDSN
jgi:uncharacterized protein YecE (DUF72 family)